MQRQISKFVRECDGKDCNCSQSVSKVDMFRGMNIYSTTDPQKYRYITYCHKYDDRPIKVTKPTDKRNSHGEAQ